MIPYATAFLAVVYLTTVALAAYRSIRKERIKSATRWRNGAWIAVLPGLNEALAGHWSNAAWWLLAIAACAANAWFEVRAARRAAA